MGQMRRKTRFGAVFLVASAATASSSPSTAPRIILPRAPAPNDIAAVENFCSWQRKEGASDAIAQYQQILRYEFTRGTPFAYVQNALKELSDKAGLPITVELEPSPVCLASITYQADMCGVYRTRFEGFGPLFLDTDGDGLEESLNVTSRQSVTGDRVLLYLDPLFQSDTSSRHLATPNALAGKTVPGLTIELPQPTGTYRAKVPFTGDITGVPSSGCYYARVADVNSDRQPDIVIANPYRIGFDRYGFPSSDVTHLCGNGRGEYDRKFCKPKAPKPPHLRIRHQY